MVKADPESRSRPRAAGSRSRKRNRTVTRSQSPAQQDHRDPRRLLARIVETPHLARAVPRLPAEVLHRIIESCSLEDCAELVALTTTDQLSVLWDLDLWRSVEPGTANPFHRLRAMRTLREAGVHAGVLMAPVLPGITDSVASIEAVAAAAREHNAA